MSKTVSRTLVVVLALGPAGGCAERPAGESAENRIALEIVSRFDTHAPPAPVPFGSVVDIEVGSSGSVFVLDGFGQTVSVFDSTGAPLTSFGRRGEGPGELVRAAGMTLGPDGRLWILDAGTGRITVFEPDGRLVATYRASGPRPWSPVTMAFSGDGALRAVGVEAGDGSLEGPRVVLAEYRVGESVVEPERQVDLPFVHWVDIFNHRDDAISLMIPLPFAPEPLFGIDPDGRLWYGDAGPGRVRRWVAADSFDLEVGRDVPPIPVTSADIAGVLEGSRDAEELRTLGGGVYADFLDRIPDHHPGVQGFFFGDDGSVWVMRTPSVATGDGPRPTDVYDAAGELLATVELDLAASPRPRLRNGWLSGVVRDELGVESVALYRVTGADP